MRSWAEKRGGQPRIERTNGRTALYTPSPSFSHWPLLTLNRSRIIIEAVALGAA